MTFSNCDLIKRSFTNVGIGFTFNNELKENLYKKADDLELLLSTYMINNDRKVSKMKSASSKQAFKILLENNVEENKFYENTKNEEDPTGQTNLKPRKIKVSLHDPREPANLRSNSFNVPLGHATRVYIYPKATEIDISGKELTESQRNCRLNEINEGLDIFNIYTNEGCIQECQIRQAFTKCGCIPWNYLPIKVGVSHLKAYRF